MTEKGKMAVDLNDAVQQYGELEIRLQRMMTARCQAYCSRCAAPCCKVVYCYESLDSPFLALVRQRFSASAKWDAENGWLTAKGCGLTAGRPPVCYEFICTTIMKAQTSAGCSRAINDLAMLMTKAGKYACGKRHVVELDQLDRLNLQRLMVQFGKAQEVLKRMDVVKLPRYLPGGGLPAAPSR